MTEVFIIQNHDQNYLTKQGEWVEGSDANQLFRSPYKDEAINMKVEQSVRNPELRLSIIACQLNDKGQLRLGNQAKSGNEEATSSSIDSSNEVLFNNVPPATQTHEPTDHAEGSEEASGETAPSDDQHNTIPQPQ